jgi:archaemetzincin
MPLERRRRFGVLAAVVAVLPWAIVWLRGPDPVKRAELIRAERLEPRFEALKPLHAPLGRPGPADWLAQHREEGLTFAEYVASHPVRATPSRRTLYLQPLGDFTPAQLRVLARTADFISRFYQLPVKQLDALPSSVVPASARRINPVGGQPQVLTTYVLDQVLIPRRPDDALAMLALTAEDLYPADDWNFVFGQASLKDRVGVWSLWRNGDPEKEPVLYLTRTLKTAVHELGHMLSLPHCTAYECVLNGSNHQEESDRRPLELCPACLQKLQWNIGFDPKKRFEALAEFSADAGLSENLALVKESLEALGRAPPPPQ